MVVRQVYGPEGLGKTAMGGHPRRLMQAVGNSTAARLVPGTIAEDGRIESTPVERRRAQESGSAEVSLAASQQQQQQAAFRVTAGMQVGNLT